MIQKKLPPTPTLSRVHVSRLDFRQMLMTLVSVKGTAAVRCKITQCDTKAQLYLIYGGAAGLLGKRRPPLVPSAEARPRDR